MEKTTKKVRPKSVAVRPKKEATAARKSTFAIIFVLQKGKAREDGTAPIVARITVNHEMVHFATRMYIHPDRWLPKDYRTAGKSCEEKQINDALDELRVLIRRRYDQMLRGEETITASMLKNAITGLDQSASTLLGVCDRFIEDYTDLLRTKQCCRETYLRYLLTRNRLEEFMRNRYRIPDIPVKEIQSRFAAEFDSWLRITYQLTNNSTMKLMRQLKTMLRVGHLNGWSKNDPLAGYKIHFEKVDRGYLTDAELSRLESKVFTTRRLEVIRDLFLFSCYTELAAKQVAEVTGAKMIRLLPEQPYSSEDVNWVNKQSRCTQEHLNKSLRPAIKPIDIDFTKVDTLFVGFPIWWHEEPAVIRTFLDNYGEQLKDKVIFPFCTSYESPMSEADATLKKGYPSLKIRKGLRLPAKSEEIKKWIKQ